MEVDYHHSLNWNVLDSDEDRLYPSGALKRKSIGSSVVISAMEEADFANESDRQPFEQDVEAELNSVSHKIKRMRLPKENFTDDRLDIDEQRDYVIKIKTLSGIVTGLTVRADDTIASIKERVEESQGIPHDQQRLIFRGRTIADDRTCRFYDITEGATLHLVLALRGGCGNNFGR